MKKLISLSVTLILVFSIVSLTFAKIIAVGSNRIDIYFDKPIELETDLESFLKEYNTREKMDQFIEEHLSEEELENFNEKYRQLGENFGRFLE